MGTQYFMTAQRVDEVDQLLTAPQIKIFRIFEIFQRFQELQDFKILRF